MGAPFIVHANLDCEARWAGITLPARVQQRISLLGALVEDVRLYDRKLAPGEIEQLARYGAAIDALGKPADKRTPAETESAFNWWLAAFDQPTRELSAGVAKLGTEDAAIKARGTIAHVMNEKKGEPIAYSEFIRQVDEGNVRYVTMASGPTGIMTIKGKLAGGSAFTTAAPGDANVSDRLIQKGVAVQVEAEEGSSIWALILYNSLPFLLILGISFFIMRQMQKNAGGGAMGFGKSRARMLTEKQGKVTFADVAGIDEAR